MNKKVKLMKIGSYLIKNGFLTVDQAKVVMAEQAKSGGPQKARFGRIAVNLGYISENVLNKAVLQKERQEFGY